MLPGRVQLVLRSAFRMTMTRAVAVQNGAFLGT